MRPSCVRNVRSRWFKRRNDEPFGTDQCSEHSEYSERTEPARSLQNPLERGGVGRCGHPQGVGRPGGGNVGLGKSGVAELLESASGFPPERSALPFDFCLRNELAGIRGDRWLPSRSGRGARSLERAGAGGESDRKIPQGKPRAAQVGPRADPEARSPTQV